MFPKLDMHCPFKARLAEAMDGDLCTICDHVVHDLDAMTPVARQEFLNGSGTVCVRYRMPAAVAAAALAMAALPVAAQEAGASEQPVPAEQYEDGGAIVGVIARVRIDHCRVVNSVTGRRTADERECRATLAQERSAMRERARR